MASFFLEYPLYIARVQLVDAMASFFLECSLYFAQVQLVAAMASFFLECSLYFAQVQPFDGTPGQIFEGRIAIERCHSESPNFMSSISYSNFLNFFSESKQER